MLISTNPLLVADQINYPPICSGVNEISKEYADIYIECTLEFRNQIDQWYRECGLVRKPSLSYVQPSEYFNVLLYPKMLNYFQPEQLDGNWIQLSSTIVKDEVNRYIQDQGWTTECAVGKEILTDEFLRKTGKLIFFSLGTIVSQNVKIFQELISILGDCPHKFIVSKGKFDDQIELPSNCVGASNINQLEILQLVDLFISHGGNNSFTGKSAC